ncbi:MAG TPA: permease-like cell division protein FtsX [Ignavibacteriaceae bacterium]|nr:permease-like cell division protein FtsX [Ignavibacteriaceae bacterium]
MILFSIKEALKSIKRNKLSFILSLITSTVSLILISASLSIILFSQEFKTKLTDQLVVNVFLKSSINDLEKNNIEKSLNELSCIKSIKFIDKNQALNIFIKETGDDFRKILDYNPLPESYSIKFDENCYDKDSLSAIIKNIKNNEGVDDVVYEANLTNSVITTLNSVRKYVYTITIILLIISIYIVYSTLKIIINSRQEELEIMKLVGAKIHTLKIPILLNALIIGILSLMFSFGIFYLIERYLVLTALTELIIKNYFIYIAALIIAGPILNISVSIFALKNIKLKL